VLRVSAGDPARSLAATAKAARDGDTIEIEAGDYRRDVASWPQNDLTLRGVGGRARLIADGSDAEGKAIFVIKGRRVRIENLEFTGAKVRDRNGAGIRIENGPITIANCHFVDNENGILAGNIAGVEIDIEDSVFVDNGSGDGLTHNLYVGTIARLSVTGCWLARARIGHLIKSRARESVIQYNRLSGEQERSSYELEFPSGGTALVMGNVIQQGPRSENHTIVSFGAEGYRWPENSLTMAFNTLVNDRTQGGVFVRVAAGASRVELVDNILVGKGSLEIDGPFLDRGNIVAAPTEFSDPRAFDYRLRLRSSLVGRAGAWGANESGKLRPSREYQYQSGSCPIDRPSPISPLSPGAFQRLAP